MFVFLVAASVIAWADEVQFTASSNSPVAVGDNFAVTFTVNAQGSGFKGPAFNGFTILSGPNQSTSSSIRSVNGRTSMTISNSYTYYLQANREGTFTLASASILVDGKTYQSNTLSIKVVSGGNRSAGNQGGNTQQRQSNNAGSSEISSKDVFLKATADNYNPLQGEGIIVTYRIYTRVPVAQITPNKISSFSGFWSQTLLKEDEKVKQYNETVDGITYNVGEIRKISLFPLKSGTLTIEPMQLTCVAQLRRQRKVNTGDPFFDNFFNDDFFNSSIANVEKTLRSNPLSIQVRPLPDKDRPADFSGAVGSFTFSSSIDKSSLKANEPISVKYTVKGRGNIQLIDQLNTSFPPDFETYDPKITSDIQTNAGGVSGSKTFEYLVIPRNPGKYTIKPVVFTYFDLATKKYVSISSAEYTVQVAKGTGSTGGYAYSGVNKEDIRYLGSDIRFIQTEPFSLRKKGTFFFGSSFFVFSLVFPLGIFIAILVIFRKRAERRKDVMMMKNRKATRVARNRLKKASSYLKTGQKDFFYEEISRALWGYLSDKFSIPVSELSMETVQQALLERQVSESIIIQFMETLNNTDFARFAPGDKSVMMDKSYSEAMDIISRIEQELK